MRTVATPLLAVAATSALIGLAASASTATAPESGTTGTRFEAAVTAPVAKAAEPVIEKGYVFECTGEADGLSAYVNLYENDTYSTYLQVILDDDPEQAASREPKDILRGTKVRTGIKVAGKQATIVGTARKVGPRKPVHQEVDDAGQHVVMHGFHRRLAHRLVLRYDDTTVPLTCAPAFYFHLKVTTTDTTGD
jgi:hypothetical protein